MFNIIINIITWLISTLISIVLLPVSAIIQVISSTTGLDVSLYFTSILQFLQYGLAYIPFFVDLLCIPSGLFIIVITFNIAMLAAFLSFNAINLFIRAYKTFKP